jgi:RNA polymerase-binding transcription factor DksA
VKKTARAKLLPPKKHKAREEGDKPGPKKATPGGKQKLTKAATRPVRSANGKAKKSAGRNNQSFTINANHAQPKQRRLDPFTRAQKEKLLQLRDAMVDSMAGVAQDTLRARAEGSEASAFGMHQADAGSDAYDRDFALSLLSQEQDALYEIDEALKRTTSAPTANARCRVNQSCARASRRFLLPASRSNASRSSRSKTKPRAFASRSLRSLA